MDSPTQRLIAAFQDAPLDLAAAAGLVHGWLACVDAASYWQPAIYTEDGGQALWCHPTIRAHVDELLSD